MKSIFIILLSLTTCLSKQNDGADDWKLHLRNELKSYLITHKKPQSLKDIKFHQLLTKRHTPTERKLLQPYVCGACDVILDIVITAHQNGADKSLIVYIFTQICKWVQLETDFACETYAKNNIDIFLYAIDNNPTIKSTTYCAYSLQQFRCQDPDRVNWTINIPPKNNLQYSLVRQQNEEAIRSIKVLHITDIHYDPAYEPGSNTQCGLPLCCQKGSKTINDDDKAGYWGSYSCDSPWQAIENVLTHVMEQHETIDMVYFTGDIIKHSEWLTGVSANTNDILKVYDKFKEIFKNIPVFPILGNHEPHPAHQYSSNGVLKPGLSTQWLFDLVSKSWKTWLPEEALATVLKGGYYTVLIKPGFRIIALNSNVCYNANNWLFFKDIDPYGQLQWMVNILQMAEHNQEKVHIISHIPSNEPTCFFNWASEYVKILERYSHIITAQFNGHTHDEDTIAYFNSKNRSEAIGVAFVGGSATTFRYLNPNYKVFDVDPNTFEVLNFETWTYNITEANLTPNIPPHWYKLYNFKDAFGVSSVRPQDIANLALRMTNETALLQEYYRFKKRDADPALEIGCNRDCELQNLCYIVTPWYGDESYCEYYTELYNKNNPV